jgi:hypothetical protein
VKNSNRLIAIVVVSGSLFGCGGGSSGGAGGPNPAPVTVQTFPNAAPVMGDWYVFSTVTTPTLPAGTAPTSTYRTRYFNAVNNDNSYSRTIQVSTNTYSTSDAITAAGGVASSKSGSRLCTFTPSYGLGPPYGLAVGGTYSFSSTSSCATQPSGTPAVTTLTRNGTAVAVEQKVLPIGTFTAFKYTQTSVETNSTSKATYVSTYWVDMVSGRTIAYDETYTSTNTGATTPSAASTTSSQLVAYSFNGQPAVGAAAARFTGYWTFSFSAFGNISCPNFYVDSSGHTTGTCNTTDLLNIPYNFTLTGNIDATGNFTGSTSGGATLSGKFNTPGSGNGTTNSGGTWLASHV